MMCDFYHICRAKLKVVAARAVTLIIWAPSSTRKLFNKLENSSPMPKTVSSMVSSKPFIPKSTSGRPASYIVFRTGALIGFLSLKLGVTSFACAYISLTFFNASAHASLSPGSSYTIPSEGYSNHL